MTGEDVTIRYVAKQGLINALSTLKQLLSRRGDAFVLPHVRIVDYPNTEVRSVSTTFAWYAGFSRAGFDSQLWDLSEWKAFIDTCSDFKVNQVNMCMYGYWPFRFDEFPETTLSNYPMKVWNKENRAWIEIAYTPPEHRPRVPAGADPLRARHAAFEIFAYVGLNSYNGGYANVHKDRRAVRPSDKYLNDFDFLCLSDQRNIDYLGKCMRRLTELGLDGIIFEEARRTTGTAVASAAGSATDRSPIVAGRRQAPGEPGADDDDALPGDPGGQPGLRDRHPHAARGAGGEAGALPGGGARRPAARHLPLLGARPLLPRERVREVGAASSAPDHICARDTEGSGFSASMGRLFYMFRSNILRPDVEHLHWSIEADIDQYIGAVRHGCRGINGYLFEYTGFFLYLFAAAQYGWNAALPKAEFPRVRAAARCSATRWRRPS